MPSMSLPLHDLPFDTPQPSEVSIYEGVGKVYAWVMTESEKRHIASMLEVPESDVHLIHTRANTLQDRTICRTCGKHAGIDDIVHNALYTGIHSRDFMWETVTGVRESEGGVEHRVTCSRCGTAHEGVAQWRAYPPWITK
ncbi:RBP protein [Aspergillus carlsbadensis]|nr:RBP protein [Aspergillus carlsbadensis]